MTDYQPKSKAYYVSKCRYYDGDDSKDIFGYDDPSFAEYEKVWVNSHFEDIDFLRDNVEAYKNWGLADFNTDDGVPMTLKAVLWTRFMHWGSGYETPDDFKKWYLTNYLKTK